MTVVLKRIRDWWEPFLFRLVLALDDFVQAWFRGGVIGVTISSRTATAASHGHGWGKVGEWLLQFWPFGEDKNTGDCHGTSAIKNDCIRGSIGVLKELLCDEIVLKDRNLHEFKQQLRTQIMELLK